MINKQKLSYKIYEDKIPISSNLKSYLKEHKLNKSQFISNGDDYQVLFTASINKSRIITNTFKKLGVKISKIGKICSIKHKSVIIDQKGQQIAIKDKGYIHQF